MASLLENVIIGKRTKKTPGFHHHLVDRRIVEDFRPFIEKRQPFRAFEENTDAYQIERTGLPQGWSQPGRMGSWDPSLSFAERHTYYAWYCVRLAAALGTNYAPNPSRKALFEGKDFLKLRVFPQFEREY